MDLNRLSNVEMFKMSQFEPISGKKLRVFPEARFFTTPLYFLEAEGSILKTLCIFYNSIHWKVFK
jgi:hypothetical protein